MEDSKELVQAVKVIFKISFGFLLVGFLVGGCAIMTDRYLILDKDLIILVD